MHYFIINPNSRSGKGKRIWEELTKILEQRHILYEARMTRHVGDAIALAAEISRKGTKEKPVHLTAVGGDGTIHEVLTGIEDLSSVIFGYIPTGSGNDFCRGMGIPQDPAEALEVVLGKGSAREMDVPCIKAGNLRSRFGISIGIGYDAAVCQEVLASPAKAVLNRIGLGKLVYLFIALKQLLFISPVSAVLTLDGKRSYRFRRMYFAAVMNQKFEGGGFRFCPAARTDDGILDVIVAENMSRLRMLLSLPFAMPGYHTGFRGIHIYRCKSIEITADRRCAVHIDGESGGLRKSLRAGLEPDSIRIMLPDRSA
ncbi:MAG: diacylglycerol kinase family lipid kinase [Blautia sp.]|nr:diacylglycerol kinase family lipid kinase [Blautia sp.]